MNTVIATIAMFMQLSNYSGEPIQRQDIDCMAKAVYHEARGEEIMGQVAVAHVILNRVGHKWYSDSICGVVSQKHAFTGLKLNRVPKDEDKWKQAIEVSIFAYTGFINDPTNGAIKYHNPITAPNPSWDFGKISMVGEIGNHRFYQEK